MAYQATRHHSTVKTWASYSNPKESNAPPSSSQTSPNAIRTTPPSSHFTRGASGTTSLVSQVSIRVLSRASYVTKVRLSADWRSVRMQAFLRLIHLNIGTRRRKTWSPRRLQRNRTLLTRLVMSRLPCSILVQRPISSVRSSAVVRVAPCYRGTMISTRLGISLMDCSCPMVQVIRPIAWRVQ